MVRDGIDAPIGPTHHQRTNLVYSLIFNLFWVAFLGITLVALAAEVV